MAKKLFVGNLAYAVTEDDLRELFSQAGTCENVSLVLARDTRQSPGFAFFAMWQRGRTNTPPLPLDRHRSQSRGFAFVTMASADEAARAKKQFDGSDLKGRRLRVDEANDQSTGRGPSRGGGGGPG